jgi:MoxR-like ATPase
MSVRTKNLNKQKLAETRKIETNLINKDEVFKMLALAESVKLPILLIGVPGTGKTKTVIDYSKAFLTKNGTLSTNDFNNKLYILETDEGTKPSEVRGMPDFETLFVDNKYILNAPIATSDIVVINEVDKANSGIRNSLLGVMNERFLFNGKNKIPCIWNLFVATCNEIPKEEEKSPFWDRFMLKVNVNRISAGELAKYYAAGGKNYKESMNIGIPNKTEIENVTIDSTKLEHFISVGYNTLSDRTLTFVPTLTKAVSLIWNISIDKALVKVASIMIDTQAATTLEQKLYPTEMKNLMNKVEILNSINDSDSLERSIKEIELLANGYLSNGNLEESHIEEIEILINHVLENHPAYLQGQVTEDMLDNLDLSNIDSMSNTTADVDF